VRATALVAVLGAALVGAPGVEADSVTPISLNVTIAPVARLGQPLKVTVTVSADPSVLDARSAPLRVGVKLAPECGGEFAHTPGVVLLDRELAPQPVTGRAYAGAVSGRAGRPSAYGVQAVCTFLYEEVDARQFATDATAQVDVSPACTRAGRRLDRDRDALRRAVRRRAAQLRRQVAADRRAARRSCGAGVPL
jgi:hypothetical protein